MKTIKRGICCLSLCACVWAMAWSQESTTVAPTASVSVAPVSESQVPRLVKFSGTLLDDSGKPQSGIAGVTFLLYKDQAGGAPLWMETQNVNLDGKGHYTVLLGSSKPDGLPAELFASGEARWLGVQGERQPEQPRVLLLSVPYALKAMDAETLAGRPVSDFVLSAPSARDALVAGPRAGAGASPSGPPTQATAPLSPITGSGAKNFIPIWMGTTTLAKSTIFETAGKVGIGTGTITPANTLQVNAPNQSGLLVQGPETGVGSGIDLQTTGAGGKGWEVLATGQKAAQGNGKFNIRDLSTGQDRLTIATSGVGIGTTNPGFALDVRGNTNVSGSLFGNFAEFTGSFTGPVLNVNQGSSGGGISVLSLGGHGGIGINVQTTGANAIAVSADTTSGGGVAVLGTNETDAKFANAIQGQANGFTHETIGVWGSTQSPIGIGTLGDQGESGIFLKFEGTVGAGVWGDTKGTGGSQVGVVGTADNAIGVGAHNNGVGSPALYAQNDSTTKSALLLDAIGGSVGGECFIDVSGNLHCTGAVTGVVAVKQGTRKAALYAMESPENWFEDFGSGHLAGGVATIALDSDFAETVNTGVDYYVYVTPNGDCKGLYVSRKTASSFEVRELGKGSSSIAFDYRIVAHRRGQESVRMADMTDRLQKPEQLISGAPSVK